MKVSEIKMAKPIPEASISEQHLGWTLAPRVVEAVTKKAREKECPLSDEQTEAVACALADLGYLDVAAVEGSRK